MKKGRKGIIIRVRIGCEKDGDQVKEEEETKARNQPEDLFEEITGFEEADCGIVKEEGCCCADDSHVDQEGNAKGESRFDGIVDHGLFHGCIRLADLPRLRVWELKKKEGEGEDHKGEDEVKEREEREEE
jgi:hypothetical protein